MKSSIESLPNDPKQLKALLLDERHLTQKLKEKNQYLLEQFRLAQQKQFGKSSEKHSGQGELFNEVEQFIDEEVKIKSQEKETISDAHVKPKRKPLPKELPRETVVIDLSDEEKSCDCCGSDSHKMGEKKSEKLTFIPAQIKVIETVRPQYSCRHCEKTATKVQIKIAPVPFSPIPKSIATPSLLSQIITSKYQYSLPLYRQEAMFKQHGIELNRKTMLDDLKKWLDKTIQQVLPKSAIGKAIQYSLNQWKKRSGYIKSGDINIDNNRAERAIKPFVIGRKNWMFCNTVSGAHARAILYSLIETAKANGLTPFNYLMFLLEELPKKPENLDYLMPWNIQLDVTI